MKIITSTYDKQEEPIRSVRYAVFIEEQSVPSEMEFDDRDAVCIHVLAIDKNIPIGTGRIDIEKSGKIGRVAVLRAPSKIISHF